MTQISLLQTNYKNKTIAELAVQILSEEWPLPLKTIKRKINKEHGKKASNQATFKALKKLVEKNILLKDDLHYELNVEWLKQLNGFSLQTTQKYLTKNKENNQLVEENSTERIKLEKI